MRDGSPQPATGWRPAVEAVNEAGRSPWFLLCEHASNYIPPEYLGLGLSDDDLQRHIAWDIGAAQVARRLSAALDAPLFLSCYSRLLIDLNRPTAAASSIPVMSEATEVPGNRNLSAAEIERRHALLFRPFQDRVAAALDRRRAAGIPTIVLGIHSFTPRFLGQQREWDAGILFRRAHLLGARLVAALSAEGLKVGANVPYSIGDEDDYTVPVHGEARGLDAALVEIRQDLLADEAGTSAWSARLARALEAVAPAVLEQRRAPA